MLRISFLLIGMSVVFCGCTEDMSFANTPHGNFDALWNILNEQYCFFNDPEKAVDWDEVYQRYRPAVKANMTDEELFKLLGDMLAELKDGHVNLYSSFDMARYWKWFEDYPDNFDEKIQRAYIGTDYQIAGGMKYKILTNNVGYIYYGKFSSGVGESNLDNILAKFSSCDGIIIDVRNNGGGLLTNVETIASRFTNERILTGYIQHKTGKGRNDFSQPYPTYLDPSPRIRFQKQVVVLTNRSSYSATNNFISIMRSLPTVTTVGDRSGGGGGLPFSSELPNGWSVRFSACPIYDAQMQQTESGIYPDIKQDMTLQDMLRHRDSIIERAFMVLNKETSLKQYIY